MLTWDGPADLDLALSDAGENFVYADDPTPSGSQGVFESAHSRGCDSAAGGSERIYSPAEDAPFGNYQVRLFPRKMCGDSNPRWHLQARVAGELIADFRGDREYLDLDWRLIFGGTATWEWEVAE